MAGYRKLGRTSSQRKALIRSQVTALLHNGKIVTTEARAKEIRKVAEGLIALAVKEKDNFETVKVTAKVARKDKDGKRVKETVDGKKVTVYDEVEKEIKKDKPSRLHARRQQESQRSGERQESYRIRRSRKRNQEGSSFQTSRKKTDVKGTVRCNRSTAGSCWKEEKYKERRSPEEII